jgi:hypothetical protein
LTRKLKFFSQTISFTIHTTLKKINDMPNYPAPSTPHNNYIQSPIVNNNTYYDDLSSWISYLLIQELNDNTPVTTEIITNYINNISPNDYYSPLSTTILNHDDQDLYDSDTMPSLIDDDSQPLGGFIYPSSEG